VFLDDDVRLGTRDVLKALVEHLARDPALGMVGTSQQLPPDSTPFQRRCADQIGRSRSDIVDELTESDMVTTQCCAMRRATLEEVGGFHGEIIRGVDPELRHRVRKAGYRIAIVPRQWHYHPMPATLRALLRMAYRNGAASAYARKHFPATIIETPEGHVAEFEERRSLSRRVAGRAWGLFSACVRGQVYRVLYDIAYARGMMGD